MLIRRAVLLPAIAAIFTVIAFCLLPGPADVQDLTEWYSDAQTILQEHLPSISKSRPSSQQVIRNFWAGWAQVFEDARPHMAEVSTVAGGDILSDMDSRPVDEDDRKPAPSIIDLSPESINSMRRSHAIVSQQLDLNDTEKMASNMYHGTGIVTVAGEGYTPTTLTMLHMLRRTKSTLPVQVFLQSRDEYEPYLCDDLLPTLNAECFFIEDYLSEEQAEQVSRYQLKVLAILFSPFAHVLFLDSDQIPLHDPGILFKSDPYKAHGFVSWPDIWASTENPAFWTIAGFASFPSGLPPRSSESGQLLINKLTHLSTLVLACYYNVYGPGLYYTLLGQDAPGQGDKETFLAAAVVRNASFYRVRTKASMLGWWDDAGAFRIEAIYQGDPIEDNIGVQALAANASTTSASNVSTPAPSSSFNSNASSAHNQSVASNITAEIAPQNTWALQNARPFFLHVNNNKLNAPRLMDRFEGVPGKSIPACRLLGKAEANLELFGVDVERAAWEQLVWQACEMPGPLKEMDEVPHICDRVRSHWNAVFVAEEGQESAMAEYHRHSGSKKGK